MIFLRLAVQDINRPDARKTGNVFHVGSDHLDHAVLKLIVLIEQGRVVCLIDNLIGKASADSVMTIGPIPVIDDIERLMPVKVVENRNSGRSGIPW